MLTKKKTIITLVTEEIPERKCINGIYSANIHCSLLCFYYVECWWYTICLFEFFPGKVIIKCNYVVYLRTIVVFVIRHVALKKKFNRFRTFV